MSEKMSPHLSLESELGTSVTNVVIMYPDARTTGEIRMTANEMSSTLEGSFYSTVQRLLQRYKKQRAEITGVVYQDTIPDNFSPLFPYESFDSLVKVPVDFIDWDRIEHKDLLESIYEELKINGNTVIGGYHAFDCVATMSQILEEKGRKAIPNLLLTDELGELLVAHKVRSILGPSYPDAERQNDRENWNFKHQEFNRIIAELRK